MKKESKIIDPERLENLLKRLFPNSYSDFAKKHIAYQISENEEEIIKEEFMATCKIKHIL